MVRLTEIYEPEYPLPELTAKEKAALDGSFEKVWKKIQTQLPRSERKCWKVTDMWGRTIMRYAEKREALESAIERNKRAESLGLKMRYRISEDNGYDET